MIKIILLEDQDKQAEAITGLLRRYEEKNGECFEVVRYSRAIDLLENYSCDADILLLDIQIPDMLGIEVARRLRQKDTTVIIMFVTSFSQYAIEGYSVEAMDYILKPVSFAPFSAKLARALRVIKQRQTEGIMMSVKTKTNIRRFPSSKLAYIEVINHNLIYHLTDGTILSQWGSLGRVEEELREYYFVRCNSGYLVNLRYVETIKGNYVIVNGDSLKISAPKRKEFLGAVAQYKGGSR